MKFFLIIFFFFIFSYKADAFPIKGDLPQSVQDKYILDVKDIEIVEWIKNLEVPWSLIFLDNNTALVSERPGRIRIIIEDKLLDEPYLILDVNNEGEGGLLGLAKNPDFPMKPYVYAMFTYKDGRRVFNKVVRIIHKGTKGQIDKVLIDKIPGGRFHNGGRIAFGPDKKLYITTGEIYESKIAQDINSLGGKILRINEDGTIPGDNPFKNSYVYSYGHRNPQGLTWHPTTKDLFSSEHGPSGEYLAFGYDEINVIIKGGNYGWPNVIGAVKSKDYVDPLIVWKNATPPSGITFYASNLYKSFKENLFVATLRSEALIRIKLGKEKDIYKVYVIERWFVDEKGKSKYGRIRDVVEGPDGALYFLTNNRDGRGVPKKDDDKIYKIIPK